MREYGLRSINWSNLGWIIYSENQTSVFGKTIETFSFFFLGKYSISDDLESSYFPYSVLLLSLSIFYKIFRSFVKLLFITTLTGIRSRDILVFLSYWN